MGEPHLNLETISHELSALRIRKGIEWMQGEIQKLEQTPIHTRHLFPKDLYVREIFIPKGTVLIGRIHRSEYVEIVFCGEVDIYTEDGIKTVKAPATFVTKPGRKRMGLTLEDTLWTSVHPNPTNETNLEKLDAELLAETLDDVERLAGCDLPEISYLTYQCA